MKANRTNIRGFKRYFHSNSPATFQIFPERKDCTVRSLYAHRKLTADRLDKLEEWNSEGAAIAMMINEGDGRGRSKENITRVTALFVDADGNCELDTLKNAPICPHLIVESSPGHFHAYWRVKGVSLDEFGRAQKKLATCFDCDPQVVDLSRVMRIPGSINWKRADPFRVRLVHIEKEPMPIQWTEFSNRMFNESTASGHSSSTGLDDERALVEKIRTALADIPADERGVWLYMGMAIHSSFPNSTGRRLWDDWSRRSTKFDEENQKRTWASFKPNRGVRLGTLFGLAENRKSNRNGDAPVWPVNELELGKLFARNCGDKLRFSTIDGEWYVCNNGIWARSKIAPNQMAVEFLMAGRSGAGKKSGGAGGTGLLTFAHAKNILSVASTEPLLQVSGDAFDSREDVLAVKNGVIHLPSGKFRAAVAEDMLSKSANVAFDADARCPTWLRFLDDVTGEDREFRKYLRKLVGYSLYGHAREQKLFAIIGSGSNGKGVFMHTIRNLLGHYGITIQGAFLRPVSSSSNSPSPALTAIKGRRFLACSEMPKDKPFDEAFVKQLTGCDPVSGRALYSDQEEFKPIGKLWLAINSMPRVRSDDEAMWRRVIPLPFDRQFLGDDVDPLLENKLEMELPGILNWALKGARMYGQEPRLDLNPKSQALLKKLRRREDSVGAWIKATCVVTPEGWVQSDLAYKSYADFMKEESARPMSRVDFKEALRKKGIEHRRTRSFNEYVGVAIRMAGTTLAN